MWPVFRWPVGLDQPWRLLSKQSQPVKQVSSILAVTANSNTHIQPKNWLKCHPWIHLNKESPEHRSLAHQCSKCLFTVERTGWSGWPAGLLFPFPCHGLLSTWPHNYRGVVSTDPAYLYTCPRIRWLKQWQEHKPHSGIYYTLIQDRTLQYNSGVQAWTSHSSLKMTKLTRHLHSHFG